MKRTLCLFVVCVSLGLSGCSYTTIMAKKDNSYDKKLSSIYIISHVEESLGSSFSKAFAQILTSAFKLINVDAAVATVTSLSLDLDSNVYLKAKKYGPDALMIIKPAGGIIGGGFIRQARFDVSLIDMKSEKIIWSALVRLFPSGDLGFGFDPDRDYSGTEVVKDLANVLANDLIAKLRLDGLI